MPSGALKNLCISVIYPNEYFKGQGWARDQIQKWINAVGGTHFDEFKPGKTTHLILSKEQWQRHDRIVEKALENRGDGKKRLEILSPEWLDDVLMNGKKLRESTYRWQTKDATSMHRARNGGLRPAPKGPGRDMRELLDEESRRYMTDEQLRQADEEARIIQEAEAEKKAAAEKIRLEHIEAWRSVNSVERKRPRKLLLSNNHVIYTDSEGFKYDVLLSKADMAKNKNERRIITIWETMARPHTYAVSVQYQASREAETHKMVAPIGANARTARREFCKVFKEFTKVDWDDRFTAFSNLGSQMDVKFEDRPFKYIPPKFGPKGDYPGSQLEKQMQAQERDQQESHDHTPATEISSHCDQGSDVEEAEKDAHNDNDQPNEEDGEGVVQNTNAGSDDDDGGEMHQQFERTPQDIEQNEEDAAAVHDQSDRVYDVSTKVTTSEANSQTFRRVPSEQLGELGANDEHDIQDAKPRMHPKQDYDYEQELMSQFVNPEALESDDENGDVSDLFATDEEMALDKKDNSQQRDSQMFSQVHAQPREFGTPHASQNHDSQEVQHTQMAQDAGRMVGMTDFTPQYQDPVHGKRKAGVDMSSRKVQRIEY